MTNAQKIFVNLPVADLAIAKAFYVALGATNNPQFSDETTSSMMLSDNVTVMLHTHEKLKVFTKKPLADARTASEVLLAISISEKADVDRLTDAAGAVGGLVDVNPPQDHGFMYGRSVEDPDGHIWELVWMNPDGMPGA